MKHNNSTEPISTKSKGSTTNEALIVRRRKRKHHRDPEEISRVYLFSELLIAVKGSRSKIRQIMSPKSKKHDPTFPKGFPLYDSRSSPKLYWKHEVNAWLEARSEKHKQNNPT